VAGFKVRASHILVGTEEEARQVLKELAGGAAFESLAAKYSKDPSSAAKGGDLGVFERGDFVPAFENAAFRLKPGQTSEAVKTPLGYHIIRRTR
jgi:parvulin-like peptidyl-prolyl isomerase